MTPSGSAPSPAGVELGEAVPRAGVEYTVAPAVAREPLGDPPQPTRMNTSTMHARRTLITTPLQGCRYGPLIARGPATSRARREPNSQHPPRSRALAPRYGKPREL